MNVHGLEPVLSIERIEGAASWSRDSVHERNVSKEKTVRLIRRNAIFNVARSTSLDFLVRMLLRRLSFSNRH